MNISVKVPKKCRISKKYTSPPRDLFGNYYEETRKKEETIEKKNNLIKLPNKIKVTDPLLFCLGYYIGDGHCYTGKDKGRYVSLAAHQKQIDTYLRKCKNWFDNIGVNSNIRKQKNSKGCEMRSYSGELALWFKEQIGRKLEEKSIAEWIHQSSKEQRKEFINGWVASDGYERRNTRQIATVKENLAAEASRMLMSIGYKPNVQYKEQIGAYSIGWVDHVDPTLTVSKIQHRTCSKKERVYDLTIKNSNSFVIGTSVVHNCQ